MRDRRRGDRRLRRDRRWSEDRRTDDVLRLYATLSQAAVLALRRMPHDLREGLAEGITAPDRRRGDDRRSRRRRSPSERRQLDDPAFVRLTPDPSETAPKTWSVGDFAGLRAAIRADSDALAELHPPESWSRERDYLYRTARAWSQTVIRLVRAVLGTLEDADLATALSLMQELRGRVQDLCLLRSYGESERSDAALRALLFQALSQVERRPTEQTPALLEHTVKDLRTRIDRRTHLEIENLVRDPTSHWSGLGASLRAERTPTVTDDRLAAVGLTARNTTRLDLHEIEVVHVAPNVKDYKPKVKATDAFVSAVALQAWDWLLAATAATRVMIGDRRPVTAS